MSELTNANKGDEVTLVNRTIDTPETHEAVERWQQGKINIFDEMARLERERDEWKSKFVQANKDYGFELRDPCGTIWDHAKKLQQECDNFQDQRDFAMTEIERLKQKTGYWESLIHWLEQVQQAHEGKDRTWDLTQLYQRGPFAGWSQERMVRLADELWENEQKHPLRGDKK